MMGGGDSSIFMVKCIDSTDPQKYKYKTKKFTEAEGLSQNNNPCKDSRSGGYAAEAGCSSHGHMGKNYVSQC